MERNLRLYPWLHVGRNALFWLPVFVLYFSSTLSPTRVLQLEALYYGAVVLLEVPSGYLSDRIGRRPVLIVAATTWVAGSALLAWGGSFGVLAAGQLLLAVGMAFQSGTDTSLLYDTLVDLDRTGELAVREAKAQSWGFATLAGSALIGGAVAGVDLRLGHALSAAGGLIAVGAALGLEEPHAGRSAAGPLQQLRDAGAYLSDPMLRWTLLWAVALTVWIHIPYELLQPWLAELVKGWDRPDYTAAPLASGVVTCVIMGLAAIAAPYGPRLAEARGAHTVLTLAWMLLVGVVGTMAIGVHVALLPILLLRSVPGALIRPILASLTHPRLPSGVRATWLSAESLLGRLAFSGALAVSATAIGGHEGWTESAMTAVLAPAAGIGAVVGLVLWVAYPAKT